MRKDRVPPGQNIEDRFPILHIGKVPQIDVSQWTLTISGLVEEELSPNYQEFMSLPRAKVLSDIHCVAGWSRLNTPLISA